MCSNLHKNDKRSYEIMMTGNNVDFLSLNDELNTL